MEQAKTSYDSVAKTLHWLIAVMIIALLAIGWIMSSESLPNGATKFALFQWHKSLGITILALSLMRLIWRFMNPPPPLPSDMKQWEAMAAKLTHLAFYVLMIGLPLVGWAMASVSQFKTSLYGFIPLPNLPILADMENKKELREMFGEAHETMAYIIAVLLVLHFGAAAKHHLINRDDVLLRMAPAMTGNFLRKIRGRK